MHTYVLFPPGWDLQGKNFSSLLDTNQIAIMANAALSFIISFLRYAGLKVNHKNDELKEFLSFYKVLRRFCWGGAELVFYWVTPRNVLSFAVERVPAPRNNRKA